MHESNYVKWKKHVNRLIQWIRGKNRQKMLCTCVVQGTTNPLVGTSWNCCGTLLKLLAGHLAGQVDWKKCQACCVFRSIIAVWRCRNFMEMNFMSKFWELSRKVHAFYLIRHYYARGIRNWWIQRSKTVSIKWLYARNLYVSNSMLNQFWIFSVKWKNICCHSNLLSFVKSHWES